MDKVTIKPSKAQEGPYIPKFGRNRPVSNSSNLDRIHGQCSCSDLQAKVFHFVLFKFALFRLQEEVMFLQSLEDMSH
jgi:hypothetical protein